MKLKAAEGRRFLKVLHRLLQTSFPLDDTYAATRFSCIQNLFLCYEEMDHWVDGGLSNSKVGTFRETALAAVLRDALSSRRVQFIDVVSVP